MQNGTASWNINNHESWWMPPHRSLFIIIYIWTKLYPYLKPRSTNQHFSPTFLRRLPAYWNMWCWVVLLIGITFTLVALTDTDQSVLHTVWTGWRQYPWIFKKAYSCVALSTVSCGGKHRGTLPLTAPSSLTAWFRHWCPMHRPRQSLSMHTKGLPRTEAYQYVHQSSLCEIPHTLIHEVIGLSNAKDLLLWTSR